MLSNLAEKQDDFPLVTEKKPEDTQPVDAYYSLGKVLQQTRLEQKKTLEDCSKALRIGRDYLQALEEGTLHTQVEQVYFLGFLKTYAQSLDLDAKELVNQYLTNTQASSRAKPFILPSAIPDEGMPKKIWVLASGVGFLILVIAGWYSYQAPVTDLDAEQSRLTQIQKSLVRDVEKPETAVVEEPQATQAVNFRDFVLHPQETLSLIATAYTWVEVTDINQNIIFTGHLRAGQTYDLAAQPGLTLSIGNAGGIVLQAGEQMTKPLGVAGEVQKNLHIRFHAID